MKVTILGSGTSTGVPEYRCQCATCVDARIPGSPNRRTRASIHVQCDGRHLQIDAGPNFVDQIDAHDIGRIDAVLYTHAHNDHIAGTNDLVLPCRKQEADMPVYAFAETLAVLQRNYDYMFSRESYQGGGIAHLLPHTVEQALDLLEFMIVPIPVEHGAVHTVGYRIENLGYVPDVKVMPEASVALLRGVEVLIIDALSFNPRHPTHFSVAQALKVIDRVEPRRAMFTHISHRLDHHTFAEQCAEQRIRLPEEVELAYDGQVVTC